MIGRLEALSPSASITQDENNQPVIETNPSTRIPCLALAKPDIINLLDALFPRSRQSQSIYGPVLEASAAAFNIQHQKEMLLYGDLIPLTKHYDMISLPQQLANESQTSQVRIGSSAKWLEHRVEALRRDLLLEDPDIISRSVHPCAENWTQIFLSNSPVYENGRLIREQKPSMDENVLSAKQRLSPSLRIVRDAVVRLALVRGRSIRIVASRSALEEGLSLEELFENEMELCRSHTESNAAHYWWSAFCSMRDNYPFCKFTRNDSKILQPLLVSYTEKTRSIETEMNRIQSQYMILKQSFDDLRSSIQSTFAELDLLRAKMWYVRDVLHSQAYSHAREVVSALNNMGFSEAYFASSWSHSSGRGRTSSRSSSSSIYSQSLEQTSILMKASEDQGGPRKLADAQVAITKQWLNQRGNHNFCEGEERIHRFCLEVFNIARRLIGETIAASPDLWAGDLFDREKRLFDGQSNRNVGYSPTSRSSSVVSQESPSSHGSQGQYHRTSEYASRQGVFDLHNSLGRKGSFHGSTSSRPLRDPPNADTFSVTTSPYRTTSIGTSVPTTDSASGVWTPAPTGPISAASMSSPSRPASSYYDVTSSKRFEKMDEKKRKFLDLMRTETTSLLLSDLSCPLFVCGSETDSWLNEVVKREPMIEEATRRRKLEDIYIGKKSALFLKEQTILTAAQKRSVSMTPYAKGINQHIRRFSKPQDTAGTPPTAAVPFIYEEEYSQILNHCSRFADPSVKLEALKNLHILALSAVNDRISTQSDSETQLSRARQIRRNSLNPGKASSTKSDYHSEPKKALPESKSSEAKEAILELKAAFTAIRPKTLFRDLQLLATFISQEVLASQANAVAFERVAAAALDYKKDIVKNMVNVAMRDSIQNQPLNSPARRSMPAARARELAQWYVYAAQEGDAQAMRELATLYLSHPDHIKPVSKALTPPTEVFHPDRLYKPNRSSYQNVTRSFCLALHWMQLASAHGDKVAKKELQSRSQTNPIR